jgi:hypothetical protein
MPRPRRNPARNETESQRPRAGIPAGRGDLIQRRRRGIFVETQSKTISSSVRSGIFRHTQTISLLTELGIFVERKLQICRAYGAIHFQAVKPKILFL